MSIALAPVASADPVPGPPYVDHVQWSKWGDLSSLRVYPTHAAHASRPVEPGTDSQADEAWTEVLTFSPDADMPGMKAQFLCHWHFAELAEPGKVSWNLEPWRNEVADEADGRGGLQSRRHRRTVLVAALQPRGPSPRASTTPCSSPRRPRPTSVSLAARSRRTRRVRGVRIADHGCDCQVVPTGGFAIASVVGFPSGKHLSVIKAEEARLAAAAGADEIDMVIDVGSALEGELDAVKSDIAAVFDAIPSHVILKVIVESAVLLASAGEQRLVDVCRAAEDAGADFVKTSTGFHPSGGASVRAVELMAGTVGDRLGVKASGGIRTAEAAVAMLDAGATRLGLSGTRAVLDGLD